MEAPSIPEKEWERLEKLESYSILDTPAEPEYDEITRIAAQICGTPIALISLVDKDRQWFKSKQGLQASETSREVSFCGHAINTPDHLFEVQDAKLDERFKDNPLVIADPNVIYYLGAPLVAPTGEAVGTLCVIDHEPKEVSAEAKATLQLLSRQVVYQLELRKQNVQLQATTKRLQLEIKERQKAEEALKLARDRAMEVSRIKDQFLSNISHEIRTPLNGVVGITALLLESPHLQKDQKELLQDLDFSAHHLLRILNDILDLTRIRENRLKFKNSDFELPKFLNNLFKLLFQSAEEKGIDFITDMDNKLPTYVNGDPDRLGQIILNIAGNAIKFTEEGSAGINVKLLSEDLEKVHIRFQIIDTGIGIPKEKLDTIFEMFSQFRLSASSKFVGLGLGLPIAKSLIEQFGGVLEVDSKVGTGSTFTFDIWLTPGKRPSSGQAMESYSSTEDQIRSSKPLEILLVEDNMMNQKVARRNLERFGFNTYITANGQEALEVLKEKDFDLILMDINMPIMDGLETTRRIRKSKGHYKDIKIMAWTASVLNEDTHAIFEAGMDDFISKPFKPKELLQKILALTKN